MPEQFPLTLEIADYMDWSGAMTVEKPHNGYCWATFHAVNRDGVPFNERVALTQQKVADWTGVCI